MRIGPYTRAGMAMVFIPLYCGPLLAGMASHPLAVIPVCAIGFLGYIAMTRKPNLHTPDGLAALAIIGVVQLVLVTALFGIGVLVSSVFPVALPLWLPVALTLAAAAFGALSYTNSAEMDVFLDGAIEKLEALDRDIASDWSDIHPEPKPAVQAAVDRALAAVQALPKDARGAEIDPIVQQLEIDADVAAFDPLYDAAGQEGDAYDPRVDMALLRFVCSPYIRRQLVEQGEAGLGPMLLLNAPSPATRFEARSLIFTLIDETAPLSQLPDPVWLDELDAAFPGESFDDLARLRRDLAAAAQMRRKVPVDVA